jgi:hypothetical protein
MLTKVNRDQGATRGRRTMSAASRASEAGIFGRTKVPFSQMPFAGNLRYSDIPERRGVHSRSWCMEASPTLVINYFSGFKQNLVPLFQRPYTWTEKQWRTLWEDVISFYECNANDTNSTHFMGAIVTMPARSVPVGISKFLIIDGQQRLATIAVMMCAIRDSLKQDEQISSPPNTNPLSNE